MITIDLHKGLNAPSGKMQLTVHLEMEHGQLLALYGKSGVGKTSILRMLAGLLSPNEGLIEVDGKIWFDKKNDIKLPPQQREVGMVFQDYALFPNMTVFENLQFALAKDQDSQIINELIDIMELGDLGKRKPYKLSGGQQQRVALARALVQRPKLLLLDEPLSALDTEMRTKLQDYILKVHRAFGLNTILVSHNEAEVRRMADVIVLLENGRVIKQGSAAKVFGSTHLPELLGKVKTIVEKDGQMYFVVTTNSGEFEIPAIGQEANENWVGKEIRINVQL